MSHIRTLHKSCWTVAGSTFIFLLSGCCNLNIPGHLPPNTGVSINLTKDGKLIVLDSNGSQLQPVKRPDAIDNAKILAEIQLLYLNPCYLKWESIGYPPQYFLLPGVSDKDCAKYGGVVRP